MAKKTIEMIAKKVLKWHRAEVVVLWLLIAIGAILVPTGIGIYFNVGRLATVEQVSTIPTRDLMISEVKMLSSFAKAIGAVFSLTGIAVIILALDRLSLTKAAYRMASFIRKGEG